jgi:hypothetical protein
VQDLVDPADREKRCELLLRFGEALLATGETEHVIANIATEVLKLADSLDDQSRAFLLC